MKETQIDVACGKFCSQNHWFTLSGWPSAVADPEGVQGGSLEIPFQTKLFHFHGNILEN